MFNDISPWIYVNVLLSCFQQRRRPTVQPEVYVQLFLHSGESFDPATSKERHLSRDSPTWVQIQTAKCRTPYISFTPTLGQFTKPANEVAGPKLTCCLKILLGESGSPAESGFHRHSGLPTGGVIVASSKPNISGGGICIVLTAQLFTLSE